MPGERPDHGPDDGQGAPGGPGRPEFAWLAGSAATGPVSAGDALRLGGDPSGSGRRPADPAMLS